MDGYVLADSGTEVLEAIHADGVRYATRLADGSGFVAWEGRPPPISGRVVIAVDQEDDGWWWYKIRKLAPTDQDHFYVLSPEAFGVLTDEAPGLIDAATTLTDGRVIVQTCAPLLQFSGFGGHAVEYHYDAAVYG